MFSIGQMEDETTATVDSGTTFVNSKSDRNSDDACIQVSSFTVAASGSQCEVGSNVMCQLECS